MSHHLSARTLNIRGIVQGVGFRPFIYQLALRYGLKGTVANDASGVVIHVEGSAENMVAFSRAISEQKPALSHITEIIARENQPKCFSGFSIIPSKARKFRNTLLAPDIATCQDCLRELTDPTDHRFRYPFLNCTRCGPRYTIINDIPYDRRNTSMRHFEMCGTCRSEYDNPTDRRFHAQPTACPDCGPGVTLHDNHGRRIDTDDAIAEAARLLKSGRILAVKGLGGFHLAADAENNAAIRRLRQKKRRKEKPFALMSPDLDRIRQFAVVKPEEQVLLTSPQRPIVLIKKNEPNPIAEAVAPGNCYFGIMLPYTPLHHLLTGHGFSALVMTSGNLSEEPLVHENDDALSRLAGIADYFLIHNRDIYLRCDDSIARHAAGETRMIRRSRGYVPTPIFLRHKNPQILACGAELKNTICLTKDANAFISQHIGDMKNKHTFDFFTRTISHMKRILDIEPQVVAHDLHPDYLSTRYALDQTDVRHIAVQHHHAHIVSCMVENQLDGEVIGLAFDGTGYGADGHIWGGEILIANPATFERAAHLAYVPMPGGEAVIKEPWRMAASFLQGTMDEDFVDLDLPAFENISEKNLQLISRMIRQGINSPLTSSVGRLFDAVAAITGIRQYVHFEGQAAMELEMAATDGSRPPDETEIYPYQMPSLPDKKIPVSPIITGIVQDLRQGVSRGQISTRFHWTLIRLFAEVCDLIRSRRGLNRVALSGGVFQNAILLEGLIRTLENLGFDVYSHRLVPTNDGGISLGQAVAAAEVIKTM